MSHQAVTWAYQQDVKPSGTKFVLVTIANYADGDGHCYPGQGKLADDTGMNERHVRRCLKELEDFGLLHRRHRYDRNGKRTSDEFWLIGFKPLPDDIAASLPDIVSGSDELLPDISDTTTGHFEHDYRTICPVPIRNLNRQREPSEEPLVKTDADDKPLTTFEGLYEVKTGQPYIRGQTDVPDGLAEELGGVAKELAGMGVNGTHGEDVLIRWPRLRKKHPKSSIHALPGHWHSLRDEEWAAYLKAMNGERDGRRRSTTVDSAREVFDELSEPDRTGGGARGTHQRSSVPGAGGSQDMGSQIPRLPDGRPGRDT